MTVTNYLPEFLTVALVHLLAVMSPGPDFILITRNSLLCSRRAAVLSALGLGLGILVHVAYCLVGIGYIISKSILLFSVLKFLGAGYLIYIGVKCLGAKKVEAGVFIHNGGRELGDVAAVKMGFLTNVLNPKATLFFFALFTQVISPQTPPIVQIFYGLYMSAATFAWFAFVALVLSHAAIRQRFVSVQHRLEQFFGLLLIALGIKVAFLRAQ